MTLHVVDRDCGQAARNTAPIGATIVRDPQAVGGKARICHPNSVGVARVNGNAIDGGRRHTGSGNVNPGWARAEAIHGLEDLGGQTRCI